MIDLAHINQYLRSTDGVNQLQRSLPALDPSFIRVDERSKSDLINFVKELSKQIRFYDLNNQSRGDWSPFFDKLDPVNAILVKAATTSALPLVIYKTGEGGFGASLTASAIGPLLTQDGVPMADGDLLLVWQQEALAENGIYTVSQGTGSTPFVLRRAENSDKTSEFNQQIIEIESGVENERRFFIQQTVNPAVGTSDIIYVKGGLSRRDWPANQALFMAFLHLFSIAQRDLNELTGRHLRYYYEKVLQLQRRAARPDQVHVVFEPAKNAVPALLPAGTLLDAGKTSDGKTNRQYALDNEIIVNHALVKSLKSAYADKNTAGQAIIFKAEDATLVKSDAGTGWRPFGSTQLSRSPALRTMVEAKLGFAIASAALLLAEGERKITITLHLQMSALSATPSFPQNIGQEQIFTNLFEIALTGEKEWMVPIDFTAKFIAAGNVETGQVVSRKLMLIIGVPSAEDPIVAYDEAIHGVGYRTGWPVFRCLIRPDSFQLEALGSFMISNIDVEVSALNVKNLILQNDESIQLVGKPILPFTSQPRILNNFYIGSTEVFSKTIQSLTLSLEWQDPPENFSEHYQGYDNTNIGYDKFITNMHLLAGKSWDTVLLINEPLFNGDATASIKKMRVNAPYLQNSIQTTSFERKTDLADIEEFSSSVNQGFIKLVLTGPTKSDVVNMPADAPFEAFGHKSYPTIYTRKIIGLSKNPVEGDGILPNQPYTPTLKSVTLDYSAKETFIPSIPNGNDQYFLLDIFGNAEINKNETAWLAPPFSAQGALYIGLEKAAPPQTLSFLFQIERGNVPGIELLEKQDLNWSYLVDNLWQSLTAGDILEDATDALQKPGIIRLNLGSNASATGLAMPEGLHWLRLSVNQKADGAGALQELVAQAARATLVSNIRDTQVQVIQPKRITRLATKVSAVKSVKQDYPSFNGLAPESDASFFRRISERLRHRNRAVTGWDYERLVLEAFPDVFKIKCLPYTDENNKIIPGYVKLIVVPDMRVHKGGDLLQPKNNLAFLRQIESFLKAKYLDGFVTPHAANPVYETLLVDCRVSFLPGYDPGYYSEQLQEDIRRFLSPWAYEEGQDIIFGGKIYKSEILAFVEGRPYVDFVINFQLYHRYQGEGLAGGISCMKIGSDFIVTARPSPTIGNINKGIRGKTIGVDFVIGQPSEIAVATRPDAILVSNAVHRIQVLQAGSFECSGVQAIGIGKMIISLDLIIV